MLLLQDLNSFRITLYLTIILCVGSMFTQELYAQDPILFEHTWYLEKVFDGEDEYYIADYTNYTATTEFFEVDNYIYVKLCDFDWMASTPEFFPNNDPGFILTTFDYNVFATDCDEVYSDNYQNFDFIRNKIFTVFFEWPEPVHFYNPFTYTFAQTGNEAQLIIENVEGKKAYYNSFPLSIHEMREHKFIIYPNPVQETLFIDHLNTGKPYTAKVYSLNGNKLFDFTIKNNHTEVNLPNLSPGIYFLVIESETGMKFTEKIIKR